MKFRTSKTRKFPSTTTRCDPSHVAAGSWSEASQPTRSASAGGVANDRYAERLAPGTKFADIIGEIDPAKLAAGVSMGVEEALHFGLIPACTAASSP